ncbi:unnamed protein product [Phytophthora fragariaefolia]|uniref:Unnamed protein product n=1 Tax=Phytophthora fragariaefolia TaxID=1490495 RepID=A0A9W6XV94_9STRA|nr:unnamed protein product [Phytophthora fragariaefolia]
MRRRASAASLTPDAVSSVVSGEAPHDCCEQLYTLVNGVTGDVEGDISLDQLPSLDALLELEEMSVAEFGEAIKAGALAEVVMIRPEDGSAILKYPSEPMYPLVVEFGDVVSKDPPLGLPPDRGVRHEIDLVPETKYCITRQRSLPKEQGDVIDAFFLHAAGLVRESKSPHSTPTFCVRKPNDKWRIVHVFNKLNAATIPAQKPIPRNDVLQNIMVGCTLCAEHGKSDMENHIDHLRVVLECIRMNKLYTNADKCIFCDEEIPFLECFIGKRGLRADPAKVNAIVDWPVPANQKDLRNCALLQADDEGRGRVIAFEYRQRKAAEKNYPVHDKGLLAMKYALVKFRVHLLGSKPFVIYTDHASLRTATQSPHLSQRTTRWLSFFAKYNFEMKYKPGRQNALADALSRRPDYKLAHVTSVTSSLTDMIREAYARDDVF